MFTFGKKTYTNMCPVDTAYTLLFLLILPFLAFLMAVIAVLFWAYMWLFDNENISQF